MMTVRLIAHTPEPEKVVAAAAKLCYSDAHITDLLDGLDEEKTAKFLTMLSDLGHASPIEHASFTFGIEGVSRTLLAQITRHRIASFSVQSQRYESSSERITWPSTLGNSQPCGVCFCLPIEVWYEGVTQEVSKTLNAPLPHSKETLLQSNQVS